MESSIDDVLIYQGGEIKSLGHGKVGGYLVLFGSAESPDLAGDYFTPETDFGFDGAKSIRTRLYYDHGMDPTLGKLPVGSAELKIDAKGVWAEGQVKAREDYSRAVKEILGKDVPDLIAGKKLGFSSGTAPHLVSRKKVGSAHEITSWPLGLDASLTAQPCEPRTQAVSLKSWTPSVLKGIHLGEMAEPAAAMMAVQHLHGRLHERTWNHLADDKSAPKDRLKRISDAYDECKETCMRAMTALMRPAAADADADADDEAKRVEIKQALALQAQVIAFEADLARFQLS